MNNDPDTYFEGLTPADPVAWKQAFLAFKAEQVDLRALKDDDDVAEAAATCLRYGNAEQELLALAAPDINGVIEKLFILFGDDLWAETEEAIQMLTTIGDLRRIEILTS